MVYSFARVSAVVGMNVDDYYQQGKCWWLRRHEKGGKHHELPVHHKWEESLDAYLRPPASLTKKARHCGAA
jgi:integrase/recombinase XerD